MKELTPELKAQLKKNRLSTYASRIYEMEMDIVAHTATENHTAVKLAQKHIEDLTKAYAAVEAME